MREQWTVQSEFRYRRAVKVNNKLNCYTGNQKKLFSIGLEILGRRHFPSYSTASGH